MKLEISLTILFALNLAVLSSGRPNSYSSGCPCAAPIKFYNLPPPQPYQPMQGRNYFAEWEGIGTDQENLYDEWTGERRLTKPAIEQSMDFMRMLNQVQRKTNNY